MPLWIKKIFSFTKKVFLVIVVFFVVINLLLYFIKRDAPTITFDPIQKSRDEVYKLINNQKLKSTKEGRITLSVYRIAVCGMVGEGCTDNPTDGDKNYGKSALGLLSNLISTTYANPPASGAYWAYSSLQKAGFVPKTYAAQGVGFAAIKPLMNIWTLFRDVAYSILVLVLIVIGFMIMFRMKLNPQTVITVENSLPRIVVSLILITFSFAISGFLIDIMYIIMLLGISILSKNTVQHFDAVAYQSSIINSGGSALLKGIFQGNIWQIGPAIFNILPGQINTALRTIGGIVVYGLLTTIKVGGIGDNIFKGEALNGIIELGGIPKFIMALIIAIIVVPIIAILMPYVLSLLVYLTALFVYFRIMFVLFGAYLQILLMIIFSPFFMLVNAIPGQNVFGYWLKNLLANLLIFPIVAILIVLSSIIAALGANPGAFWQPPFMSGISANAFSVLVGIGILFSIPDLIKTVKELLGAKGLPISVGVGTFFGGVATGVSGVTGLMGQVGSVNLGLSAIAGEQNILKNIKNMFGSKTTKQGTTNPATGK